MGLSRLISALSLCVALSSVGGPAHSGTATPADPVRAGAHAGLAAAAAAAKGGTLLVDAPVTVSASATIPADVLLRVANGGVITVGAGVTLTILGPVEAGHYRIFDCRGNGRVAFSTFMKTTSWIEGASATDHVAPEWWGARPGDQSPAAQAANVLAFRAALTTRMPVRVGAGYFYVNDAIEFGLGGHGLNGRIEGAGRYNSGIHQTDSTKNILSTSGGGNTMYNYTIRELSFQGGRSGVYIETGNDDKANITIEACIFREQAAAGVETSSTSNSTGLSIERCTFVTPGAIPSALAVRVGRCDYTFIDKCWVELNGDSAFLNGGGTMIVKEMIGVTRGGGKGAWIENHGSAHLAGNRFGADGDGRGRTIVHQRATGNLVSLFVRDNFINTSDYAFRFDAIPMNLSITGNFGYGALGGGRQTRGIRISPSAEKLYAGSGKVEIGDPELRFLQDGSGSAEGNNWLLLKADAGRETRTTAIAFSEITASFGVAELFANVSVSEGKRADDAAYEHIDGVRVREIASTGDGCTATMYRSDVRIAEPGENCTFVLDLVVDGANPANLSVNFAGDVRRFQLSPGTHVLNVPTRPQPVNGKPDYYSISVDQLAAGDRIRFGRFRVFRGEKSVTTPATTITDRAAATPPSGPKFAWRTGDRWNYADPVPGGAIGKVVTAGGGGWKPWGAVAP